MSLSGVVVPPGQHSIDVTYADATVTAGVTLSVLAALTALALVILDRLLARRRLAVQAVASVAAESSVLQ